MTCSNFNYLKDDINDNTDGKYVKGASVKNTKFTESVLNYVSTSNAAVSTVSNPSFLSMIKAANPTLSVPCRQTFSSKVIPLGVCIFC